MYLQVVLDTLLAADENRLSGFPFWQLFPVHFLSFFKWPCFESWQTAHAGESCSNRKGLNNQGPVLFSAVSPQTPLTLQ